MMKRSLCHITVVFFLLLKIPVASGQQKITNPILAGFYPDPSICRVGNDYYLVNSSFAYYPGLPVFHSKDLVHWQQIGAAMDRPEQLILDGAGVSRGLFAPTIRYNDGVFYIMCTLIDKGGNFIITAKNPAGPWSNPVWIPEVKGIDPSIDFIDGKAYIVFNSDPPDNKTLWSGHRTIRMYAFDHKAMKVTGKEILLVNGGTDISKKPVWIEGPHLYKKDDYIYLMCAEGGTGYNHSEVIFRSKNVEGPYEPWDKNPILTQRTLDPKRKNPVTTTGHADLVQTKEGNWYAVFLGCRPYEADYINNGRETFMAPVEWKDGWPVINPGYEEVQYRYVTQSSSKNKTASAFSGNYSFRDGFDKTLLNNRYSFLRTVREPWYNLNDKKGFLSLHLGPQTAAGKGNPSFIGFRQAHLKGEASTALSFTAASENEKAGLLVFQNEQHYYWLCQSVENGQQVLQLLKSAATTDKEPELLAAEKIEAVPGKNIELKIKANGNTYAFYYALKKGDWQLLKDGVDAKFLSTQVAGGFVGCMYAMYATSNGKSSSSKAYFDWFGYKGDDDVYKK